MNFRKKILALLLCGISVFGGFSFVGCDTEGNMMKNAPDYSDSEYQMNLYSHCGPSNGQYTDANGNPQYAGQDFRTVERYQEYKDIGSKTLLLLGNDPYTGEDFATSQLKKNLDMAQEVGLKVVVFDLRIHDLSSNVVNGVQQDSLVGDGKQFATQDELVAHLRELTRDYITHPAFYGITLADEPVYDKLKSVGQVYRALHTIDPDMYVPVVLLPFSDEAGWVPSYAGESVSSNAITPEAAYRKYVEKYFEETEAKNLIYDDYPFRFLKGQANSEYIRNTYLMNLQMMSEYATQNGAKLELCIQTFSMDAGLRKVTEEDVRWQANTAMSFGVQNLICFTYWMHPNQLSGPGQEGKNSAIMDNFGNKILYDEVQRVNRESQSLAKIIFNYEYQKTYFNFTSLNPPAYFVGVKSVEELDGIEEIEMQETTMINQMYDEQKGLYGYFVLNETDPFSQKSNEVTIKFDKKYKYLMLVNRGEITYQELDDQNSVTLDLERGDGCFVIPYN